MAARRPDDPTAHVGRAGDDGAGGGRLRGADAVRLHLTLGVGLAVCAAAFVFEMSRALGGNTLSWAYVFEWPIFAVFAVYMWWNLLHGQDGARRSRTPPAPASGRPTPGRPTPGPSAGGARAAAPASASATSPRAGDDDADLRAWQAYLRDLEAQDARHAEADTPE